MRPVAAPGSPPPCNAEAEKRAAFLHLLHREKEANCRFVSPSALFEPGNRQVPLGSERISGRSGGQELDLVRGFPEDFAVTVAGEIEQAAQVRQRFTVGY